MRKITGYRVTDVNGNEFVTNNYAEAKANGNYIEEILLSEVDTTTEKQKKAMFAHADKIMKKLGR